MTRNDFYKTKFCFFATVVFALLTILSYKFNHRFSLTVLSSVSVTMFLLFSSFFLNGLILLRKKRKFLENLEAEDTKAWLNDFDSAIDPTESSGLNSLAAEGHGSSEIQTIF